MKQVILPIEPKDKIAVKDCSISGEVIYGLKRQSGKYILTQSKYDSGEFEWLKLGDETTRGNGLCQSHSSLQKAIESQLEDGHTVTQLNGTKELGEWLLS